MNRGPDSRPTVQLWLDVGGKGVIGNHEVYALCVRAGRWPRKGDTLDDLFQAEDADALLEKLRELPVLVHLDGSQGGPEAWVVHAGVDPRWNDLHAVAERINPPPHDDDWLEHEVVSFATRVRCCTEDGARSRYNLQPEGCPPPYRPWDELYRGETLIVHGHWASRGYYRGPRTIGLDSGCVYGGFLTAWCQQEDRVVQVPSRDR